MPLRTFGVIFLIGVKFKFKMSDHGNQIYMIEYLKMIKYPLLYLYLAFKWSSKKV